MSGLRSVRITGPGLWFDLPAWFNELKVLVPGAGDCCICFRQPTGRPRLATGFPPPAAAAASRKAL